MASEKVVPDWPVIGIDLGTTYSCVAVWRNGHAEVILNDINQRLTPSSVAFTKHGLLVGEAAKNQITSNPENTIYDVKRLIGRRYSEDEVRSDITLWSFKVEKTEKDEPRILVIDKDEERILTAQEISSMVLHKLKSSAEEYLGLEVKNAVITVPAYFNDSQRRATKDAARVAGLNVVRVINEPTAAALAYAQDEKHRSNENNKVLIFDLGGGTFDVSIVEINGPQFNVKATQGDTHLGGEDFDNRMVEYLAKQFNKENKNNNIDITKHPKPLRRLRKEWEKMKRSLSYQKAVTIDIDALHMEIDFSMRITRAKFEELNKDLFRKCLDPVTKCLADAAYTKKDINEVVLVGGSSRIPKIQQILKEFFEGKRELCHTVNPDEAVALGAAIQGAILSGVADPNIAHLQVKDVTPLSLGINDGGKMSCVVNRCTPIPIGIPTTRRTTFDYQTKMRFEVYEGERGIAKENHHLGDVVLEGITSARAGEVEVELIFDVDEDGILTVIASEKTSGKRTETKITNDAGRLSDETIEKMIKEADRWRPHDDLHKKRLYARNELEARLSDYMTNKLNDENSSLLKRKMGLVTYNRVKVIASELKEWMDSNARDANYDELQKKKMELKKMESLISPAFS